MSSIITNTSFIQKLTSDLIKAKKLNYSQQCFTYYLQQNRFIIEDIPQVKNRRNQTLKCTLIKHSYTYVYSHSHNPPTQNSQPIDILNQKCIIFLHGLGSSRLEGLPLANKLPKDYCLCIFDMSGSGKSDGDSITYGVREQEDIQAIIDCLTSRKSIKSYILWGRSMGAVAVLLYAIQISKPQHPNSLQKLNAIKSLVIDSPFYNFSQITRHIAIQKMSIPQFVLDLGIHLINESFEKLLFDEETQRSYNPFQIQFDKEIKSKIPAIFIASETDQVVPILHCQKIIRNYKFDFQKITMENVSHNQQRPDQTIEQIFFFIKKLEEKNKRRQKNAIQTETTIKFDLGLHHSLFQKKKGIAVFTPSKSKPKFSDTSIANITQSQVKSRFLDTFDINLQKKLYRNPSKGLTRTVQEHKKRVFQQTYRLKNSPCNIPERRKTSNFQQPLFDTLNFQYSEATNEKIKSSNRRQSNGAAGQLRGRRSNNFMRKVEPKLSHSRYL